MNYRKAKKKWFKQTVYSWSVDTLMADNQLLNQLKIMDTERGFWLARKINIKDYIGFRFTRRKFYT